MTRAVAKIIWPDLTNAHGPPLSCRRMSTRAASWLQDQARRFEWDDQSIAK